MTAHPWLTIVTVVKDDPDGLERTLHSLLGADLAHIEHLIIDSSANLAHVPARVAALGLPSRVVWTKPEGVYAAMNSGMAEATGEFIHYLNAGDELASPGILPRLRLLLQDTNATWLDGAVEIVGAFGDVVVTPPWDYEQERTWAFSRGRFPAHQGTVVRTDALRSIGGFDTSFTVVADYAAFLHLTRVSAPLRFDGAIARFHEGGISTTRWARSLREFHRARVAIVQPTGVLARRERWATARQFVAMAAYRSPWPLAVTLTIACLLVLSSVGVAWPGSAAFGLLALLLGTTGALWWRMMRPNRSVPVVEALGMGLGLGTAGAAIAGLVGAWWLAPLVVLLVWLFARQRVAPLAPLARPDLLALTVGLATGLGALLLVSTAHPTAWTEQTTLTLVTGNLTVPAALPPLIGLVAAVALTAAWTRQLTRVWWIPAVVIGCLVAIGGFIAAAMGSSPGPGTPFLILSGAWLLTLLMVAKESIGRAGWLWALPALVVLVASITMFLGVYLWSSVYAS